MSTFERADLGPLAKVSAKPAGERWTLVMERRFSISNETLWAALTEPEILKGWSAFIPDRTLSEPGMVLFTMIDSDECVEFPGRILNCQPPHQLAYFLGTDHVVWHLDEDSEDVQVKLEHTVQGPDWLSKVAAGWHICFEVLARQFGGSPVNPVVGNAALDNGWTELEAEYAASLSSG